MIASVVPVGAGDGVLVDGPAGRRLNACGRACGRTRWAAGRAATTTPSRATGGDVPALLAQPERPPSGL